MSEQPPVDGTYWQRPQGWQPPDEATVPRRRLGRSVWVVAAVLVLLTVAVAAWRLWPSERDEAQQAAEQFVAAVADGDCARAADLSTSDLDDQIDTYCDEQSGSVVAGLLGDRKPTVEVTEVDGDEATASVSTSVLGVALRVEMSMLREDGQWRVARFGLPDGLPGQLPGG
jgi:cbb3-type cytochrome oxidase subunit 3